MLTLLSLDSLRLNRQTHIGAHLSALTGLASRAGHPAVSRVAFRAEDVRRELQACRGGVLYLIGHSEGRGGMVVGEKPALGGRALAAWLPRRPGRLPHAMIFNTCDAVSSGLVNGALGAGVASVAAAAMVIPISAMCAYGEALFESWLVEDVPLSQAVQTANEAFTEGGPRFEVFGDPSVRISRSIGCSLGSFVLPDVRTLY